ncbi:MAG: SGNH/GDSL hydrolase family protein [Lachnospiraceae bacterium]|nr:SGNH/GDSL hydrolase family protein [Lachnospiraceae bacterium]
MKRRLRKVNEILLISIFVLTALLAAVVGLKAYDIYVTNAKQEEKEFAEVLARNAEAQNRVTQMETEIQELTKDRQKLEQFITNIQAVENSPASDGTDFGKGSLLDGTVSGDAGLSENSVSANGMILGGTVSENAGVSDNTLSGNGSVTGNTVSGNGSVSGNMVSGNDLLRDGVLVSGNSSISDNSTVSGDLLGGWQGNGGYVQPEMTLEERRQLHTSLEETMEVNQEDLIKIAESQIDFSGKKIACLGDSITAASNLDSEEDYQQYSYPANLKELLGAEEVYNLGIGGSSIGRYWADAFVDRYQDIPEDVDIIIVMGGTNDGFCAADKEFGSLNERAYRTFCGDLDELMRGLREKYPDADIFFATPLPNILHDYLMSERDYLLPQKNFADVILTLAQEYDYEVIDLYNSNILDSHDVNIVADYMPDGVHGNHEGYRILAEHFAAALVEYYEEQEAAKEDMSVSGNSVDDRSGREQISENAIEDYGIEDRDERRLQTVQ